MTGNWTPRRFDGLLPIFGAAHEEGVHDQAFSCVPGRPASLTIETEELEHFLRVERNRHEVVTIFASLLEGLGRA
jgi:hypothetical protein